MLMLFCLLLLLLSPLPIEGTLSFLDPDSNKWATVFEVVPKLRFVTQQEIVNKTIAAVWLENSDYELFCAQQDKAKLQEKYHNKMLIVPTKYYNLVCNGRIGLYKEDTWLIEWCSFSAGVIRLDTEFTVPGLSANQHDGDYYEGLKNRHPSIQNCTFLDTTALFGMEMKGDYFLELAKSGHEILVNFTTDQNRLLAICDTIGFKIFGNYLVAVGFVVVSISSVRGLLQYVKSSDGRGGRKLTAQVVALVVNGVSSFILCVITFPGPNFTGSFWRYPVAMAFTPNLFASNVAVNLLIAAILRRAKSRIADEDISKEQNVLLFLILLMFALDIIFAYELANMGADVHFFALGTTLVMVLGQVSVGLFHLRTTRDMIQLLRESVASLEDKVDGQQPPNYAYRSKAVLKSLMVWTRVSVIADFVSTLALILSTPARSDPAWYVINYALFQYTRVVSMFAQIQICAPSSPSTQRTSRTVVHTMTPTTPGRAMSSFSALSSFS